MTGNQMISRLKLKLDLVTKLTTPYFTDSELLVYLNEGTNRFIKQRVFGNNPKQQGLDSSSKRYDDLRTLIVKDTATAVGTDVTDITPNIRTVTLPVDYLYFIRLLVSLSKTTADGVAQSAHTVPCELVPLSTLMEDMQMSYRNKNLYREFPACYMENNLIKIMFDSYTTLTGITGQLFYVKKPTEIAATGTEYSSLPAHTHEEIIDEALLLILGSIESQRIQVQSQLNSTNE